MRHEPEQARALRAFGWEFFAPSNEDRPGRALTHRQLVEAAVELESLPEVSKHREAFRTWTGEETLQGTDPEAARVKTCWRATRRRSGRHACRSRSAGRSASSKRVQKWLRPGSHSSGPAGSPNFSGRLKSFSSST